MYVDICSKSWMLTCRDNQDDRACQPYQSNSCNEAKKRQQSKDLVIIVRQAGGAVCGNFQSRLHVTTTSISSSHTSENQNCIIISAYKYKVMFLIDYMHVHMYSMGPITSITDICTMKSYQ